MSKWQNNNTWDSNVPPPHHSNNQYSMMLNFSDHIGTPVLSSWYGCSSAYTKYAHTINTHTYYINPYTYHYMGVFEYVGDVGVGGEGGGMRRKRHQTRSKIINRLSAEH